MVQKKGNQNGQATLEFIILVPVLFSMILIIALAGWWSYTKLSAQNAAYAWNIWTPALKPHPHSGRSGDTYAIENVLQSPNGMKEMWGETVGEVRLHPRFKWHRRGGVGVTVWIYPGEILPRDKFIEIIFGLGDDFVPRGSSYFFYGPFNSAEEFDW